MIVLPEVDEVRWEECGNYISKSRIALFDMCEVKYRRQYVAKDIPREDTHATSIGSRFHEFAELFMGVADKYPCDKWKTFVHNDFVAEERLMLNWFIDREEIRFENFNDTWKPVALEYRVVNDKYQIRGIIDRIDMVNDDTLKIVEYKTSKSIQKKKLQMEFGFYALLIEDIKELQQFKFIYEVLYPRLQTVVQFNPSRKSTIVKRLEKIRTCIKTDNFKPLCKGGEYSLPFCSVCTLEEIDEYNRNYKKMT